MQRLSSVPSRTEQVYHSVRESICDCILEPGTHLVQEELAATLGVSRQPIQQAMLLLKNDGLVVESGGRGLFVAPIDRAGMEHHYQIRLVLDQLATRLVAERARSDPGFQSRLRREGDAILAVGKGAEKSGSAAEAVRHDVAFHTFIYDMSGNPLIQPTAEAHWLFLRRVMIGVLLHARRGPLVWAQHQHILDALVAGDVEGAVSLATEHVTGAQNALLQSMASGAADHLFGTKSAF
ncbi:GntR family transcriptional regulator [Maliponia aquimaris]|uniref:Putative HTH-type transcriptional regulator YdfH n=1 Tax=Maliponia aquimaris TaxID=1673631 RepID=A0A238JRG0_9RHOB|nr:GntR family transcriptional regulator [Maliponia aquimaris]SMX33135.1 putative HTH-type transcriptional regulator YdfH [Maliponia aquimaris]